MQTFFTPQGFTLILQYFTVQNQIYKYLKLVKKLEKLVASIDIHIGNYWHPSEILGWVLKPPGVDRVHLITFLTTPMTIENYFFGIHSIFISLACRLILC